MNATEAIPVAVIVFCVLFIAATAYITRKRHALWDIIPNPPHSASEKTMQIAGSSNAASNNDSEPLLSIVTQTQAHTDAANNAETINDHELLSRWHIRYGQTVSDWIANHQEVLTAINAAGLQVQVDKRTEIMSEHEKLNPKMREAIASHPSPVMRAELSALQVASEASLFAVFKSDYASARRQHLIYLQYRDEWIERLQQFSSQPMSNLRAVMQHTDGFELEEIRDALEDALVQTTRDVNATPEFEAPLLMRNEHSALTSIHEQPDHVLETVVGNPDPKAVAQDAGPISELEGGRVRRALRSIKAKTVAKRSKNESN